MIKYCCEALTQRHSALLAAQIIPLAGQIVPFPSTTLINDKDAALSIDKDEAKIAHVLYCCEEYLIV